jgi:hypothetical protein
MIFEELLANFPDLKKDICYKILENPIYYLEDIKDAPTSFKSDTEYWNLCLENSSPTKILLLENEFSIMKNETSKKCDWVLFKNNRLYFVESKDIKMKQRNKERKDATKQLIASIEFYKSKLDLTSVSILSQICFKSNSRIIKAGDQARKVLFKQHNSDFVESNYILFK